MEDTKYDVIIVGGGIVGCSIAWKLSRYNLKVGLLEKEPDIAAGTTKANTAIIHAGYNADPHKLKGELNVKGSRQVGKIVEELGVPFQRIGSLVVAIEGDDTKVIDNLYKRGKENKVEGLEIVGPEWLRENEPNLNPDAVKALWAPTAASISPWEYALAMAQNAELNGVHVIRETEVKDVITEDGRVAAVNTNRGQYRTDFVVNAAGLFSDNVARMVGIESISIRPRKGEYIIYDNAIDFQVNHIVFPVPTPISKGIVVNKTVDGNLLIGPTSHTVNSKTDLATTEEGLKEVFEGAKKLFPELDLRDRIRVFAGLRAADKSEDFIIEAASEVKGFINAAGIQSPGLSSAPAIADLVLDILSDEGLKMDEKDSIVEGRPEPVRFSELNNEERAELIEEDRRYGQIVCRCETVSYKEILNAINSPVGARTVNAVKRRVRAGAGRCQGGFCGPRVVEILAKELNIDPTEVRLEKENSQVLDYKIKELLRNGVTENA